MLGPDPLEFVRHARDVLFQTVRFRLRRRQRRFGFGHASVRLRRRFRGGHSLGARRGERGGHLVAVARGILRGDDRFEDSPRGSLLRVLHRARDVHDDASKLFQ